MAMPRSTGISTKHPHEGPNRSLMGVRCGMWSPPSRVRMRLAARRPSALRRSFTGDRSRMRAEPSLLLGGEVHPVCELAVLEFHPGAQRLEHPSPRMLLAGVVAQDGEYGDVRLRGHVRADRVDRTLTPLPGQPSMMGVRAASRG